MSRRPLTVLLIAVVAAPGRPDDPPAPTVNLTGSVADPKLRDAAPADGVIVTAAAWDRLARAWAVPDPPVVDFATELLVVATTDGSKINLTTRLDDGMNLRVLAVATRDKRDGFRYAVRSVSRAGVRTVNGKELPKE